MPNLRLYVPEEIAEAAKAKAEAAGKSLSAWLAELVREKSVVNGRRVSSKAWLGVGRATVSVGPGRTVSSGVIGCRRIYWTPRARHEFDSLAPWRGRASVLPFPPRSAHSSNG